MKNLKKQSFLIQFSDGSSIFIFCLDKKRETLLQYDLKLKVFNLLQNNNSLKNFKTDHNRFNLSLKSVF